MKQLVFITVIFLCPFILWAQEEKTDSVYKPVELPEGFTAKLNLVYTTINNWEGKLDLYLPPDKGTTTPLIINIHGGGWNHGVKESQGGFSTYFKAGFAVANIEYRLTSQAKAPAAVEDTRCAILYLLKNAISFNINPEKIVIMGGSAGGHLAMMGGLMQHNKLFDGNCVSHEKVKIAAIIDKYGIADVWDWAYGKNITSRSATNWLGSRSKDEAFAKSLSPISYIDKNSPPIFIVHGDADPTVPYQQSQLLNEKLGQAGVKHEFITIAGGLHGKFTKEQNSDLNKRILLFLKELNITK